MTLVNMVKNQLLKQKIRMSDVSLDGYVHKHDRIISSASVSKCPEKQFERNFSISEKFMKELHCYGSKGQCKC